MQLNLNKYYGKTKTFLLVIRTLILFEELESVWSGFRVRWVNFFIFCSVSFPYVSSFLYLYVFAYLCFLSIFQSVYNLVSS